MIEQAYGEGERHGARHLEDCPECARSLDELRADLSGLRGTEAPARGDSYGEQVWSAIQGSLPVYAKTRRPRLAGWSGAGIVAGRLRGLAYAGVCALLVAVAFYAGRNWEHWTARPNTAQNGTPKGGGAQGKTPQALQPIVVVVLSDHLDRSERLLVELKHVDARNSDMMPPLRDEAESLLKANRVCRKRAEESGDPALETALDRLDHLFTEMSDQSGGLDAAAIARLKEEMNADGLLFEVRVLRTRVHDQKPAGEGRLNGGTV